MYGDYMSTPEWEEQRKTRYKEIDKEVELEESIFRISHPILAKLDDTRMWLGRKILGV